MRGSLAVAVGGVLFFLGLVFTLLNLVNWWEEASRWAGGGAGPLVLAVPVLLTWAAWVGVFVAFSLPFMFAGTEYIGPAIWACVLLLIAVIVYAMVHGRVVYAKRIDDEEVRLGGCGEQAAHR